MIMEEGSPVMRSGDSAKGICTTKAVVLRKSLELQASPQSGGLELLCQSSKIHNVDVKPNPGEDKLTMRDLLAWVKSNLIKERPEMFVKGGSARPGVLVLINDCDWELCGSLDTELEEKDVVVFISTLHGG
ncbi:hypothetical protein MUK42_10814 [Musa troglodytarum]|uniref:Ubiquitin-related modifier 1 homolog n=1 Tax=Musa troglodytarum TaxID=320322 RepID=A0A9E7GSP1_9LILI|nr:hypothetical protein MUK42_10814 [Musa troglodytarum]